MLKHFGLGLQADLFQFVRLYTGEIKCFMIFGFLLLHSRAFDNG